MLVCLRVWCVPLCVYLIGLCVRLECCVVACLLVSVFVCLFVCLFVSLFICLFVRARVLICFVCVDAFRVVLFRFVLI